MENSKLRFIAAALLFALPIAACAARPGDESLRSVKGQPTPISIMTAYYSKEAPADDNIIVREAERRTHTALSINWVSPINYGDKVNLTLASGDIPDMLMILDMHTPQVRQMAQSGAFWDLTELVRDYPNLMKLPEPSWASTAMQDGRIYGIPRVRPLEGGGRFPYIRKDWLDRLGLAVPETMEDMYRVMKAFAERDPDGDGSKNTYGMTGPLDWVFNVFNGTAGWWKEENGELIHTVFTPQTRESLLWLNRVYREGLMPANFAILKNPQTVKQIERGEAGISSDTVGEVWRSHEVLLETDPRADLFPLTYLIGPFGKYNIREPGHFGMFVIPNKVAPDKVRRILEFMDYGASEEGAELGSYGFRDIHFIERDGLKFNTERARRENVSQQAFGQIFIAYDQYMRAYFSGMSGAIYERNRNIIDERAQISVPDPAYALYSETNDKLGPEYVNRINELRTRVIMGLEPIDSWDRYVEKLSSDYGFQSIVREMNRSYREKMRGGR